MSDPVSMDFNQDQPGGHPHDLLARLYREIGISAVAAALEANNFTSQPDENAAIDNYDRRSALIEEIQNNIAA